MPGPGGRGPGGPGRMGHGGPPPPPPPRHGWERRRGCLPGCLIYVLGAGGLIVLLAVGLFALL